MRREQAGSSFENERTFSLSELCEKLKKKQAGWDWEEETLTLQSEADPEWSSNPGPDGSISRACISTYRSLVKTFMSEQRDILPS
jgi:hypothetical protein